MGGKTTVFDDIIVKWRVQPWSCPRRGGRHRYREGGPTGGLSRAMGPAEPVGRRLSFRLLLTAGLVCFVDHLSASSILVSVSIPMYDVFVTPNVNGEKSKRDWSILGLVRSPSPVKLIHSFPPAFRKTAIEVEGRTGAVLFLFPGSGRNDSATRTCG